MSSTSPRAFEDQHHDARPRGPAALVVWHEVLFAYTAPATLACMAALFKGQRELAIAALTSIAGTSALTATLLATWLQRHGDTNKLTAGTTRPRLVAACAIAAITVGLVIAAIVAGLLPSAIGLRRAHWLDRLWLDLPLSAGISAAIVTSRWRSALDRRRPAPI